LLSKLVWEFALELVWEFVSDAVLEFASELVIKIISELVVWGFALELVLEFASELVLELVSDAVMLELCSKSFKTLFIPLAREFSNFKPNYLYTFSFSGWLLVLRADPKLSFISKPYTTTMKINSKDSNRR
jgi:hypothetical protein